MSALLGVFGAALPDDARAARMLGAMRSRGADVVELWRGKGALLAVARHAWEQAPHFSGSSMVVDDGQVVCVADASIYYRDELRRKLAAASIACADDASASQLVLHAYRAWGSDAARGLEGDFAFIIWDRRTHRVTCARDLGGKRPLYHAHLGDTLVVASLASAVVEHEACPRDIDLASVAATISQLWQCGDETGYAAVRELLAARTLTWQPAAAQPPRIAPNWEPPPIGRGSALRFEDAAEMLRELLVRSAAERMIPGETNAVWMSGGWDSSSVFAAGQEALRRTRTDAAAHLRPVSISYPEGDPGREDELIADIAQHWKVPVHWLSIADIPLIGDRPDQRAAERDAPYAHTYEHWNRALAAGSRVLGARVAFDGNGGDQLFQISDIFLSDLFRTGRWGQLVREWRTKGGQGARTFARWVVAPTVPDAAFRLLQRARGVEASRYLDRALAPWVPAEFADQHRLMARERATMPARRGDRGWRHEAFLFLTAPVFARAFRSLAQFALEAGVELRSPLLDRRVIEFACTRPVEERNTGRESKRLLRRAMRGLLPDYLLAPRPFRTGVTSAYSDRSMRAEFPPHLENALRDPILAELGVVDRDRLMRGWEEFLRTGANELKIPLFLTLHAELWVRSRLRPGREVRRELPGARLPVVVRH